MKVIVGVLLAAGVAVGTSLVGGCSSGGSGGGKNYYVNAVDGDDLATGRKKQEAWQTIDRVNTADLQPGDTVLFRTGQVWREQLVVPASGTAEKPITFGAYGSAAAPVISGAEVVSGWEPAGGEVHAKVGLALETPGQAGVVVEDGAPLTFWEWQGDVAATFATASAGSYSLDPTTDTLYAWATDGADPDTHTMEVALREHCVVVDGRSHVDVQDLRVIRAASHGCLVTDSDHVVFARVTIRENGGRWIAVAGGVHVGNGIEWGGSSQDCFLVDSFVTDNFDSGASPQLNDPDTVMFQIGIISNTFERNGLFGVEVSIPSDLGTGSTVETILLEQNLIRSTGKGWSRNRSGQGVGLFAAPGFGSQIRDVVLRWNEITANATAGVRISFDTGPVTIERNMIHANGVSGVEVFDDQVMPSNPETGQLFLHYNVIYENVANGFQIDTVAGDGFEVYNNVFESNGEDGSGTVNFALISSQGPRAIRNNIFSSRDSVVFHSEEDLAGVFLSDYNDFWRPNDGLLVYHVGDFYRTSEFAQYQAVIGSNEEHSFAADPQYFSVADDRYDTLATSPCVDAGIEVGLTGDFYQVPVPTGSGVDIGAFER